MSPTRTRMFRIRIFPQRWARTCIPFSRTTRNVIFGRSSSTFPSIFIVSSLGIVLCLKVKKHVHQTTFPSNCQSLYTVPREKFVFWTDRQQFVFIFMTIPSPFTSCIDRQQKLKLLFAGCTTPELKYEKIIALGRQLPPFPQELKLPGCLVKGCQSQMYLHSTLID